MVHVGRAQYAVSAQGFGHSHHFSVYGYWWRRTQRKIPTRLLPYVYIAARKKAIYSAVVYAQPFLLSRILLRPNTVSFEAVQQWPTSLYRLVAARRRAQAQEVLRERDGVLARSHMSTEHKQVRSSP